MPAATLAVVRCPVMITLGPCRNLCHVNNPPNWLLPSELIERKKELGQALEAVEPLERGGPSDLFSSQNNCDGRHRHKPEHARQWNPDWGSQRCVRQPRRPSKLPQTRF
jgi:hypothetical protein